MKYEDLPRNGKGDVIPEEVEFPVEIPLLRPVETGGRKLEDLTLREPDAVDIELCWKADTEMSRMIILVSTLASLTPDDVRTLKAVDFMRVTRVVGAFL